MTVQLQAVLERAAQALADEPVADRTVFLARLQRYWPDLLDGLTVAYGAEVVSLAPRVVDVAVAGFLARPDDLRMLDLRRHLPGRLRPRAGLPGEPGHRRPPDQRLVRLARRAVGRRRRPAAGRPAVRRHLLAHLVVLGYGGLPLLWMGDELALLNDDAWVADPTHADDNRWVHRPRMPWPVAERRTVRGSVEHRVWQVIRSAVEVRSAMPAMHASYEAELLDPVNPTVAAWVRRAPAQTVVALHNLSESPQVWPRWAVPLDGPLRDALSSAAVDDDPVVLGPYDVRWLVLR